MRLAFIFTLLICASGIHAGEPDIDFAGVFDPAAARRPKPGEWFEYIVAFPVDPLENSLRPDAAPPPPSDPAADQGVVMADNETFFIQPAFEPPVSWRQLPLRLTVLGPSDDADGLKVRVTFEGETLEMVLPLLPPTGNTKFHYDEPQPDPKRTGQRIGEHFYEVDVVRHTGEGYGFVRYTNPELPFGIARFATETLDLILIGTGGGLEPDFPLRLREPPQPAPGQLYPEGKP